MTEFHASAPIWTDSVEIYAKRQIDGKVYALVAEGINLVEVKQGELWPKFISISGMDREAVQGLFDALYAIGLRPHKGEASSAHVEAMKYHLEDMRKLVFK